MLNTGHLTSSSTAGGSFWRGHLDPSQFPVSNFMAFAMSLSNVDTVFDGIISGWLGRGSKVVSNMKITSDPNDIIVIGGGIGERLHRTPVGGRLPYPQPRSLAIGTSDGMPEGLSNLQGLLYGLDESGSSNRNSQPLYVLPVTQGLTVISIASPGTPLIAGIHFESREGYMVFRDHPSKFLPSGGDITVNTGVMAANPTADYVLSADISQGQDVAAYYRLRQTPGTLLAAACSAAGLIKIPDNNTISSVDNRLGDGSVYTMSDGSILDVPYSHITLAAGAEVTAGSFVGASPVLCNNSPGAWWLSVDWRDGVSMLQFSPWDLLIPNRIVEVGCVNGAGGVYARIPVVGASSLVSAWHAQCSAHANTALCTAAGVLYGQTTHLNPVYLFAEYVWSSSALVVTLNAQGLDLVIANRLVAFLRRERPLGKSIIITDPMS